MVQNGKASDTLIDQIAARIGKAHVLSDADSCSFYSQDVFTKANAAVAVVQPANTEELAECVRIATQLGYDVIPRGGGMSYTSGYVPDELGPDGKIIKSNDDRTPYQLKRFGRGLKSINIWYGSMYTTTLVCDWEMPEAAENAAPIDKRGTPETTASKDCAL